jgi:cyclopropane fatty-acyl-phospholipid synthase-like methyltransferase
MAFSFNQAYRGSPPWDIGRPQAEFVKVAKEGEVTGKVLDIGCGTGENAIFFASLGLEVCGLDAAPLAIEKARKKAIKRDKKVRFLLGDALHLERLKEEFDTITDCGLFHVFTDEERQKFAKSLRTALTDSGSYIMLCFSDKEPSGWGGPRRVSRGEIKETFSSGWKVNYIKDARFSTSFNDEGGKALLCSISSA